MIGRRKPRTDPVSDAVAAAVFARDGGCIREKLEPGSHECRDAFGTPHSSTDLRRLTLDHVHDGYGMMGKRAPSDVLHLVAVCWSSHLGGWSTAKVNRELVRWYLGSRAA